MSILNRPETVDLKVSTRRQSNFWYRSGALAIVVLLTLVPTIEAQVASAQEAIEKLEGCDEKGRNDGCINILRREPYGDPQRVTTRSRGGADEGKEAIKAQMRGGRIIWYEYDNRTGKVRRTN